ncbi:class I SAM-dependent methyltransferase [[Eubacterium] cellulosolvens]
MIIVEVGCGNDITHPFNPQYPYADIFIDIIRPQKKRLNFVVADAHYLPLKRESIDRIYASHLIEHLRNPSKFLRDCYRCLKKNGNINIWTPNAFSPNSIGRTHFHKFTFFSLHRILKMNGFFPHWRSYVVNPIFHFKIRRIIITLVTTFLDELYVQGIKR